MKVSGDFQRLWTKPSVHIHGFKVGDPLKKMQFLVSNATVFCVFIITITTEDLCARCWVTHEKHLLPARKTWLDQGH